MPEGRLERTRRAYTEPPDAPQAEADRANRDDAGRADPDRVLLSDVLDDSTCALLRELLRLT